MRNCRMNCENFLFQSVAVLEGGGGAFFLLRDSINADTKCLPLYYFEICIFG